MPIVAGDIDYRLSGGAANADPDLSLGGVKSSQLAPADQFDDVNSTESSAGDTEYRCFYVHNDHPTLPLQNPVIWFLSNNTSGRVTMGLGTSAINGVEQTVANENTAPAGVSFSQPASKGAGLALGSIPAGQHKAVWLRRLVAPATGAVNDTYQIRVEGDTAA